MVTMRVATHPADSRGSSRLVLRMWRMSWTGTPTTVPVSTYWLPDQVLVFTFRGANEGQHLPSSLSGNCDRDKLLILINESILYHSLSNFLSSCNYIHHDLILPIRNAIGFDPCLHYARGLTYTSRVNEFTLFEVDSKRRTHYRTVPVGGPGPSHLHLGQKVQKIIRNSNLLVLPPPFQQEVHFHQLRPPLWLRSCFCCHAVM